MHELGIALKIALFGRYYQQTPAFLGETFKFRGQSCTDGRNAIEYDETVIFEGGIIKGALCDTSVQKG
jgi:hypothetical protein